MKQDLYRRFVEQRLNIYLYNHHCFQKIIDKKRCATWTVIVVTAPNREKAYAFDFGL